MTSETLKKLLRQHQEHEIWINGTTVATEVFFADIFDIASETLIGVLTELELVRAIFNGDGGEPNLRKYPCPS